MRRWRRRRKYASSIRRPCGGRERADAHTPQPRKPTLRKIILFSSLLLAFLALMIAASLALSRPRVPAARPLKFSNGTHAFAATTVLISLDGLRADFLSRHLTPTLTSFINSGVSPPYMLPSFPSVTFPNHWTLVTGLYPESHGIVSNTFWDPAQQREFYYTDPARSLQHDWWGGEPIWRTLENQGGRAAVHMWPGSEADGCGASMVDKFNASEPLERKVERIIQWLDLPADQRPQLVAAYVPDVDVAGHRYGPNTTETDHAIRRVDGMLTQLFAEMEERNLTEIVNVVVVSDHGMASTSRERILRLEDLVDTQKIEHTDGWPLYGLRPHAAENLTEIYNAVKEKETADGHWKVYLRDENMPARFHFSNNTRIAPLWIVPEAGWTIVTKKEYPPGTTAEYHLRGLHGFDNEHPLMRAIFVARGPAFRHLHGEGREWLGLDIHSGMVDANKTKGTVKMGTVEPFQNTEVYRLLAQSLELVEEATNATLKELTLVADASDSDSDSHSDEEGEKTKTTEAESETAIPASSTTSQPPPSGTPQNIDISAPPPPEGEGVHHDTADGEEAGAEDMTWWELLQSKAEHLKTKLEGWWSSVWVEEGEKADGR
jgi:predicted AlkP superfamily pyrophosphatase or phosphodiesterase